MLGVKAVLPMLRRVTVAGTEVGVPGSPTGCDVEKVKLSGKTTALDPATAAILAAKLKRKDVVVSVTGKSLELVSPNIKASPVAFTEMEGE